MSDPSISELTRTVLVGTFVLSALFGAIMQRTQFCAMGAVADIVTFADWTRMRMWVLSMGTAMVGTSALAATGQIDVAQSIYDGNQLTWLSGLLGGAMFGFGMVLASGCGSKTLVRIGNGNLKALVVFVMLAIAAYTTMRGMLAAPRVFGLDRVALTLSGPQDLASLLARHTPLSATASRLLLGGGGGLAMAAWSLWPAHARTARQVLGGGGVGALVVALWWLSGHVGFVAEDPDTLQPVFAGSSTNHMESFAFVAPLGHTLYWFLMHTDSSDVLNLGIVSVFGLVAGSAAHALATGRFRWEGFSGTEDTANHIVGGLLMGIGGITALGCTIGQGITGLSTLSLGSVIALLAIIGGAVLGVRYQTWRVEQQA